MGPRFLYLMALCCMLSCVVDAAAWEVKIINNAHKQIRYDVYEQTLWGEKLICSRFSDYTSGVVGTCSTHFMFCPTRVDVFINSFGSTGLAFYQKLESGYLGAQCWNHSVEIKPVDANTSNQNPPMTWVWSMY